MAQIFFFASVAQGEAGEETSSGRQSNRLARNERFGCDGRIKGPVDVPGDLYGQWVLLANAGEYPFK